MGGLGVGVSFGSTLAVLAHISLSRPWPAWRGGGGVGVGVGVDQKIMHVKSMCDILQRNVEMK